MLVFSPYASASLLKSLRTNSKSHVQKRAFWNEIGPENCYLLTCMEQENNTPDYTLNFPRA
ncbi:CLUMA_CG018459, isoform A [Clunio marinus]|uniref:CLUMA_CG018459, isoform A n=1 Tax=Clunio marinus TaxID=568069 RepID=A0A1J1IZA1_9DIPT|nr:CLUMA_CG018459, isoform A [Clunio marinus]